MESEGLHEGELVMVKITWTCGNPVGPRTWRRHPDWHLDQDECLGSGEFEITQYEWENLEFGQDCSSCGRELDHFCAHFEDEDGVTSYDIHEKLFGEASQLVMAPAWKADET